MESSTRHPVKLLSRRSFYFDRSIGTIPIAGGLMRILSNWKYPKSIHFSVSPFYRYYTQQGANILPDMEHDRSEEYIPVITIFQHCQPHDLAGNRLVRPRNLWNPDSTHWLRYYYMRSTKLIGYFHPLLKFK
jgi:hypothetical protein